MLELAKLFVHIDFHATRFGNVAIEPPLYGTIRFVCMAARKKNEWKKIVFNRMRARSIQLWPISVSAHFYALLWRRFFSLLHFPSSVPSYIYSTQTPFFPILPMGKRKNSPSGSESSSQSKKSKSSGSSVAEPPPDDTVYEVGE